MLTFLYRKDRISVPFFVHFLQTVCTPIWFLKAKYKKSGFMQSFVLLLYVIIWLFLFHLIVDLIYIYAQAGCQNALCYSGKQSPHKTLYIPYITAWQHPYKTQNYGYTAQYQRYPFVYKSCAFKYHTDTV